MNVIPTLGSFLLAVLVAGIAGGVAMEGTLWAIGRAGWAKANMIVALGSLLTRSRDKAWRVGAIVHAVSAVAFAVLYILAMLALGYTHLPLSMMFGAGLGVLHGLMVSLGLVWIVAEQHPLTEFNEAGLAIGLSHLVGHVAYGAAVGFIVGLFAL